MFKTFTINLETLYYVLLASCVLGVAVSYSDLYLFHIIMSSYFFLSFFIRNGKITIEHIKTKKHYMFLWFILCTAFTLVWAQSKLYVLQNIFYIAIGSGIAISLMFFISNEKRRKKTFHILSIFFLFDIGIGLLESFTGFRLPVSPYSPYAQYFGRTTKDFSELDTTSITYVLASPTGFHWNPNNFATCMSILLPFFLMHKKRWISLTGILLLLILIIRSGSRTNIIAFAFIILLYFLFFKRYKITYEKIVKIFLVIILVFFCVVLFLSTIQQYLNISDTIEEITNVFKSITKFLTSSGGDEDSISTRKQLILNGLEAFKSTYGFGVGAGNSKYVQEVRGMRITSMHNFWVELLVEYGIYFFIILALWYLSIALELYKMGRDDNQFNDDLKYMANSLSLALIGFIPAAISASSVIYFFPMYLMLGYAIAMINIKKRFLESSWE